MAVTRFLSPDQPFKSGMTRGTDADGFRYGGVKYSGPGVCAWKRGIDPCASIGLP